MDALALLIGLALAALVAYSIYRKFQSDSAELSRRFDFSEEGILERTYNKPVQFEGVGAHARAPVHGRTEGVELVDAELRAAGHYRNKKPRKAPAAEKAIKAPEEARGARKFTAPKSEAPKGDK